MKLFVTCTQERHALIIFDGARAGGGGGGGFVMWHTAATIALIFILFVFLFIQNIPKRINYITKYLDFHLNRLC